MLKEHAVRTEIISTIMQQVAQIEDLLGISKHVEVCFMRDLGIDQARVKFMGFPSPFHDLVATGSLRYIHFWLDYHIHLENGGIEL